MGQDDLERRIRKLEDIEEIKQLKHRYCAACDDSFDADAIASVFTEDAVWDGGDFGKLNGREEIRGFFQDADKRMPFAVHNVLNPIIEVNGDTAKGTWYLFQTCTFAEGNRAIWGAARYDDEYVRRDGKWMIHRLKVTSHFWTPFEDGWVKTQFV